MDSMMYRFLFKSETAIITRMIPWFVLQINVPHYFCVIEFETQSVIIVFSVNQLVVNIIIDKYARREVRTRFM